MLEGSYSSVIVSYSNYTWRCANVNLNFISKFILSNNFLIFLTDFHAREWE